MKRGFEKWFVAQFGKRDDAGFAGESDEELEIIIAVGLRAEAALRSRKIWDTSKTSALYAWQAGAK